MEFFAQDLVKDLISLKNKIAMEHERESGSVQRIHFCAYQTNSFHLDCSLKLSSVTGEPDRRIQYTCSKNIVLNPNSYVFKHAFTLYHLQWQTDET